MRKHLSFANVVSVIALFVALGGAAYAGTKINGKTIKNGSIPASKLKANVLTGLDKCPSSAPTNTQGICFSGIQPAGDWDVDARDCASKGLRLPDLGEGLLITNKVSLPYIWTTDVANTEAPSLRTIVRTDDTGFSRIAVAPKTGPQAYVCVINATN